MDRDSGNSGKSRKNTLLSGSKIEEKSLVCVSEKDEKSVDIYGNNNIDKSVSPVKYGVRLRLNNITNTRKSMANITRAYNQGKISGEKARSLAFLIQTLTATFRAEAELSLVSQVEELRKELSSLRIEEMEIPVNG